jgi:predicted nucleic acid-binding protein
VTAYLLDVNVLLALFDPNHINHESIHDGFASKEGHSWATCPLAENGFVRVASHPSYPSSPGRPAGLLKQLHEFCEAKGHVFWTDEVSLRDSKVFSRAGLLTASHGRVSSGAGSSPRGKARNLRRAHPAWGSLGWSRRRGADRKLRSEGPA